MDTADPLHDTLKAGAFPSPTASYRRCGYHRPIIALLAGFIAGIIIGRHLPGHFIVAWLFAGFAACYLIRCLRQNQGAVIAPLLLFAALGYNAISPATLPVFPPDTVRPYIDNQAHRISGRIAQSPAQTSYRTQCILDDLQIETDRQHRSKTDLPGRLRANFYGSVPDIGAGTRIVLTAKIRALNNFNNPGGFNYKQYMADQRIWGAVYGNGEKITTENQPEISFQRLIGNCRASIDSALGEVASGDGRAVLSALIIGKKEKITPALRDAFSRAGVSHLLAISGLHIGIVATCAFLLFQGLVSRFPFFLRRAWVKKAAAVMALFPVIGYGLISGMSPSTQRAVIMVSVFLAAFILDRQYNAANTLATAALAILIAAPAALFHISFQLSFAAVAAILYGLFLLPAKTDSVTASFARRIRKTVIDFSFVSAFAIVGTMPLVMHYFNQVSLLGLFSNLILVPLIGFIVVPAGLLSALVFSCWKPAAMMGFHLAAGLLHPGIGIVKYIAALPFGAFKTITPSVLEIFCVYALLIGIFFLLSQKTGRSADTAPPPSPSQSLRPDSRHKRIVAGLVLCISLILAADMGYWLHRRFFHTDFRVSILDVGQGNATLLEIPGGKTMLIDGGGFSNNEIFDVGRLLVAPYLWRNKIAAIDTVVLSHPDADHLNGLIYILQHFRIGRVISTQQPAQTAEYKNFRSIIDKKNIAHPPYEGLARHRKINGVTIGILYPPKDREKWLEPQKTNNASILLRASYKDTSLLFTGDIEKPGERHAIDMAGPRLEADILLAPHHGSKTSSSKAFLKAVDPDLAIFSSRKSRFGHPSAEMITRYEKQNIDIMETDSCGAVRIGVGADHRSILPTIAK
ncbi:MAG: DNA internalization-related competence protein ComEC/Rec2 [Thermodesulfobacteriota bacterium]